MTASNPASAVLTRTTSAAWLALLLLTLVNAFSLIDRKLPFIMLESIRAEFALSDTQVGLLGGVMFTVIYSLLGLPLARLADRTSRKLVVSGALAFWSLMTAAGALGQSFAHLALARIGLAVGEAGAVPPSQAILADYFPLRRRGVAMAVFQAGGALGVMGGLALGGRLVEAMGWRQTLVLAGMAGLALTAAMLIGLKEPRRGQSDEVRRVEAKATLGEALVALWRMRSFKWLALGGALFTLGTSAIITFGPSYLVRVRGFSIADAGAYIGVVTGLAAGAGVLVGGWVSSWNSPRRTLILAGLGLAVSAPCLYFALNTDSRLGLLVLLAAPLFLGSLYMGPSYAFAQTMAPVQMRALTASVMVFIIHGLGTSLGPLIVGAVSDGLAPSRGVDGLRLALMIAPIAYVAAAAAIAAAASRIEGDLPTSRVRAAR